MEAIRAKAMRDVRALRKHRSHATLVPLHDLTGKTFVTRAGHTLTANQFHDIIERVSKVPGLEMLERDTDGNIVPVTRAEHVCQKYIPKQMLEAMQERLCVVPERPPRPPPLPAVWVLRSLMEGKWVEVDTPWKRISPTKKTAAMRAMYDRCVLFMSTKVAQCPGASLGAGWRLTPASYGRTIVSAAQSRAVVPDTHTSTAIALMKCTRFLLRSCPLSLTYILGTATARCSHSRSRCTHIYHNGKRGCLLLCWLLTALSSGRHNSTSDPLNSCTSL
jgi:hypothetical protein